jgi:hypothetical protein
LVEQRAEAGDLIGFAVDVGVGQRDAGVLVARGHHVPVGRVSGAGAAQVLPSAAIAGFAAGWADVVRVASQSPIAAVSGSGSKACNSRRSWFRVACETCRTAFR